MQKKADPTVAIIGAGPYGVSVAAHLESVGIDYRIFGKSMQRWRHQMPQGMFLKSEGRASSLSDPSGYHTLGRFCREQDIAYHDRGLPVSLSTFTQYALWFQRNLVPKVEDETITAVDRVRDGFRLDLSSASSLTAAAVVVATGLENAAIIPQELATLPPELLSHPQDHHDLTGFGGRDVTVIGGGQSALETAALLAEQGASVRLVVRKPSLIWDQHPRGGERSVYQRLRHPASNLGEGIELWFSCEAPALWRRLPERLRLKRFKTVLGPAGAWWLKERVLARVPVLCSHHVVRARACSGGAALQLEGPNELAVEHVTDHVIAATGYRFDLERLSFLSPNLKAQLRAVYRLPVLSAGFESSVRGLYFTGLASASSFGPAMRFLAGTGYTARAVSHHIASGGRAHWSPRTLELAGATS